MPVILVTVPTPMRVRSNRTTGRNTSRFNRIWQVPKERPVWAEAPNARVEVSVK
jgi:hypothetical protein